MPHLLFAQKSDIMYKKKSHTVSEVSHMKDILRAALAVPALKVADVAYNKAAILQRIEEAHHA